MLKDYLGILKIGLRAEKFLILVLLISLFCFAKSIEAAPNTDSMLGYWKFDNNLSDSSGDGSTGIMGSPPPFYTASAAPTSFTNPQSIDFTAVGSYVDFSNQNNLRPTSEVTLSFWIYFYAAPSGMADIAGNSAGANGGFFFRLDTTRLYFYVGNGSTYANASFLNSLMPVGTWAHVTGTYDGTNIRIYLNGVEQANAAIAGLISYGVPTFRIGDFNGRMDDVRLYNRALSASEISDLAAGDHTSAIWTGSVNSDYENVSNWDIGAVPEPYTLVSINAGGSQPQFLTYPEQMAGLNINAGGELNILDRNLTINDGGLFSNNGTLALLATTAPQILSGFINDTDSGAVRIDGTVAVSGLPTGNDYYDLIINSTGTVALTDVLVVNGNLILQAGVLDVTASNHYIALLGDWINAGGNFYPWGGTVMLGGTNQLIAGSNTFNNLIKSVSTLDTLTFEAGTTQAFLNTGTLTLQGAGVTAQYLRLRSTTPGVQWIIYPQGAVNVSGLDIQDSNNISVAPIILPGINLNSGNNTNWIFDTSAPTVTNGAVASPTANNRQPVTGTATETITNVSAVEFSMDTLGGPWVACVAADGNFNSPTENFTCTPGTNLTDSAHTMYVRATDANGNIGIGVEIDSVSFTVDTTAPILIEVTPVPAVTSNTAPNYVFNADEAGTISYGGGCSAPTINAVIGNNTITFYALAQGTYASCTIRVMDAVGNVSALLLITGFTIDTFPIISSIAKSVSSSGATINWTTDENSSTQVEYGLTLGYGTTTTETNIAPRVTSHSVSLAGLSSCTTYYYRAISRDSASNEGASGGRTFKTSGCSESCSYDKPGTPDIDTASAVDADSIRLYINEASGTVDRYELKYGTGSGSYQWSVDDIGGEGTDDFLVSSLSPNTTYYFKIRAVNECEDGDWSDEISEKTDLSVSSQSNIPIISESAPVTAVAPIANSIKPNFNQETSLTWQLKYFGSDYCYDENKCAGDADPDKDGLVNNEEFRLGTDPNVPDSDSDGMADGQEIGTGHDPLKAAGSQEDDTIIYEDPKEVGEVKKETYKVTNAEFVESGGEKRIKISGKALPNSYVTLFIYSKPVVLTVKTDSNGNWSYILDKDLEDGQHEVYVAVTDRTGKITAKSEPLFFTKTAEAVTIIPSAEASALAKTAPPAEKRKNSFILYFAIVGIAGLIVALIAIGYIIKGSRKKEDAGVAA